MFYGNNLTGYANTKYWLLTGYCKNSFCWIKVDFNSQWLCTNPAVSIVSGQGYTPDDCQVEKDK